jgi:hypothetical protein
MGGVLLVADGAHEVIVFVSVEVLALIALGCGLRLAFFVVLSHLNIINIAL